MATFPLPEAAAGSRFAAYIEEVHELLATNRIAFGSPSHLAPVVERLREPGPFTDDLSSLVRSFILRQGGAMPHAQLLEILTLAIAGHEAIDAPQQLREPIRQLLGFVAGVMRRPWNVPPGERPDGEVVLFPVAEPSVPTHPAAEPAVATPITFRQPAIPAEPALEPAARSILPPVAGIVAAPNAPPLPVPSPVRPTPEPPAPIPLPQSTPEPSAPPSAIAAALVESKLMSQPAEPEVRREVPRPEPVLFLRAAAAHPSEPDEPEAVGAKPSRVASVFRNILAVTAGAAALATIGLLIYRAQKPAENFRVQPLAANTQSATAQPPPFAQTQAAPQQSYTGLSHPPKPSGDVPIADARSDRQPQEPLAWTYPEPNPAESAAAPATTAPATPEPAVPAKPESHAPVEIARPSPRPAQPQTTASNVYVPYSPSNADSRYAPYNNATTSPPAPIVRRSADARIVGDPAVVTERRDAEDAAVAGPMPVPPPHATSSYWYNVSSAAMAAKLVYAPRPEVPLFARLAHIEGPVTLQAFIKKDGTVASAHVISGPHILRGPAEDAVRHRRYLAYHVGGHPVDVETTITVDFHDGGASALH